MAKYDKADLERRMKGAVESLKQRSGRPAHRPRQHHPARSGHGRGLWQHMPLNQVATVSAPEPRMLSVQVWDKSNVGPVEKAIRSAGLGLNPINDGNTCACRSPI
jgi:ribosome recycling factor